MPTSPMTPRHSRPAALVYAHPWPLWQPNKLHAHTFLVNLETSAVCHVLRTIWLEYCCHTWGGMECRFVSLPSCPQDAFEAVIWPCTCGPLKCSYLFDLALIDLFDLLQERIYWGMSESGFLMCWQFQKKEEELVQLSVHARQKCGNVGHSFLSYIG